MEEARLAAEVAAEMAATFGDAALEEGEDMRGDESMVLDDAPTPRGSQPGDSTSMTDPGRSNRRERRQRKPTVRSRAWRTREPAQSMPLVFTR